MLNKRAKDKMSLDNNKRQKIIKKAVNNGWVKRVGTEKESGNPERYVYEILPLGKKHYKKLLKQFFDQNMIHFNNFNWIITYDNTDPIREIYQDYRVDDFDITYTANRKMKAKEVIIYSPKIKVTDFQKESVQKSLFK